MRKVLSSNPGCDRPKSLKQTVSIQLPTDRQQVRVSRFLGDDHFKWLPMSHRCDTLKILFCSMSMSDEPRCEILQPFTGNGDVSKYVWVKNSRAGRSTTSKRSPKNQTTYLDCVSEDNRWIKGNKTLKVNRCSLLFWQKFYCPELSSDDFVNDKHSETDQNCDVEI